MVAKLLWSVCVLAAPLLIYFFVIRPRLRAHFTETYTHLDGFWARVWARFVAFRTLIVGTLGITLSELPALLETIQAVDLTSLPAHWQSTIRILTIVAMIYMRAVATTPVNQPEK